MNEFEDNLVSLHGQGCWYFSHKDNCNLQRWFYENYSVALNQRKLHRAVLRIMRRGEYCTLVTRHRFYGFRGSYNQRQHLSRSMLVVFQIHQIIVSGICNLDIRHFVRGRRSLRINGCFVLYCWIIAQQVICSYVILTISLHVLYLFNIVSKMRIT